MFALSTNTRITMYTVVTLCALIVFVYQSPVTVAPWRAMREVTWGIRVSEALFPWKEVWDCNYEAAPSWFGQLLTAGDSVSTWLGREAVDVPKPYVHPLREGILWNKITDYFMGPVEIEGIALGDCTFTPEGFWIDWYVNHKRTMSKFFWLLGVYVYLVFRATIVRTPRCYQSDNGVAPNLRVRWVRPRLAWLVNLLPLTPYVEPDTSYPSAQFTGLRPMGGNHILQTHDEPILDGKGNVTGRKQVDPFRTNVVVDNASSWFMVTKHGFGYVRETVSNVSIFPYTLAMPAADNRPGNKMNAPFKDSEVQVHFWTVQKVYHVWGMKYIIGRRIIVASKQMADDMVCQRPKPMQRTDAGEAFARVMGYYNCPSNVFSLLGEGTTILAEFFSCLNNSLNR